MNYPITDQAIRDMIAVASTDGDDEVSFEGKTYFWYYNTLIGCLICSGNLLNLWSGL